MVYRVRNSAGAFASALRWLSAYRFAFEADLQLVQDGETIVLGGVFKQTKKTSTQKVPLLGDIPGLGKLFRKDTKLDEKNELLVFITPRIISDGISAR